MPVNPEVVLADWKCSLHFLASWHCPAGCSEIKKCNLAYITVPSAGSHGVGSAGCIDLLESSRVCICKDPRKRIPVPDSQYLCMPGARVGPALVGSSVQPAGLQSRHLPGVHHEDAEDVAEVAFL